MGLRSRLRKILGSKKRQAEKASFQKKPVADVPTVSQPPIHEYRPEKEPSSADEETTATPTIENSTATEAPIFQEESETAPTETVPAETVEIYSRQEESWASDYMTDDAPVRNAHHREVFESFAS